MLRPDQSLAIFTDGHFGRPEAKMAYGVLRYAPNPVACVVDSSCAGRRARAIVPAMPRDCPIVADVAAARRCGAAVLLLGIAPPGGLLPQEWGRAIDQAVALGMCVVNGLHDPLAPRYPDLPPGQWVWDVRREPAGIGVGSGRAAGLSNRRILVVGTDMAVGKMSAAIEISRAAARRGVRSRFLATGQIGIVIAGGGMPLDAIRLDYACGAVERLVLDAADAELAVIEGQGSIFHPGSTATLPLLRGACPTHLALCHRAGQTHLARHPGIAIPPLRACLALYCEIAAAAGAFAKPEIAGIALNTARLSEAEARRTIRETAEETGVPVTDAVRFGPEPILDRVLDD